MNLWMIDTFFIKIYRYTSHHRHLTEKSKKLKKKEEKIQLHHYGIDMKICS